MADQHPVDRFPRFEGAFDALQDEALGLPYVWSDELTNISLRTGEALEAITRSRISPRSRAAHDFTS